MTPVAGTTRYLCPLECGWHHDVPPPSVERAIELGAMTDPAARDFQEAVSSVVRSASFAEADRTETALREHLATPHHRAVRTDDPDPAGGGRAAEACG